MKTLNFETEAHLRNGNIKEKVKTFFVFLAFSEELRGLSLCKNTDFFF